MADHEQPLLMSDAATNVEESRQASKFGVRLTWRRVCLACFAFAFVLVGAGVVYLATIGAFSPIRRDLAFNGSHVFEPNTHLSFPVQLHSTISGQARVMRIVGLFLKTYNYAGATVRILVEAIYVERQSARKAFTHFKRGAPSYSQSPASEFAAFSHMVSTSPVPIWFKYHQIFVGVAPKIYCDNQFNDMVPFLKQSQGMTDERFNAIKSAFYAWFTADGGVVHRDYEYAVEWDDTVGTFARRGMVADPVVRNEDGKAFHQAWISADLRNYGKEGDFDLFPTLWDPRWDAL